MTPQAFCFVLTPLEVDTFLPHEIITGHILQRANHEQILKIKEKLAPYLEPLRAPPYEYSLVPRVGQPGYTAEPIPENSWRYWIISVPDTNSELMRLSMAGNLLEHEMELGFYFRRDADGGESFSWSSEFLSSFYKSRHPLSHEVTRIGIQELNEMTANYAAIKGAENDNRRIYQAIFRFHYLKALPRRSTMLVIGYFSIIEALIAHKPRLPESLDSINHQLQSKLILLSKKLQRRINFGAHFGNLAEKQIWKQLYTYRSAIAHDTLIDFDAKFKNLGGQENVLSFLSELVKLLLLFGLNEPEFLADLKEC